MIRRSKPKPKRSVKCKLCSTKIYFKSEKLKAEWEATKRTCPHCKQPYCNQHDSERELFRLQDLYYSKGVKSLDTQYLGQMYAILRPFAESLILKYFRAKINGPEDLERYSHESAMIVMEEYHKYTCKKMTDKGIPRKKARLTQKCAGCKNIECHFKMEESFGGYLVRKIVQTIDGPKNHLNGAYRVKTAKGEKPRYSMPISIDLVDDQNNRLFDLPVEDQNLQKIAESEDAVRAAEYMAKILTHDRLDDECADNHESFIRNLALKLKLEQGDKAVDRLFKLHGRKGKLMYLKSLEIAREELTTMNQSQ